MLYYIIIQSIHLSLTCREVHFIDELLQNADDCGYGASEPSFHVALSASTATFSYNERGFRPRDVVSLCSLAVSTKSGDEFLGHKGLHACVGARKSS